MSILTLPAELDARLTALAEKAHMPKEQYALQALEEFLEDQEDYLIALTRSERLEKGIDRLFSLDEALKELDLEKQDIS